MKSKTPTPPTEAELARLLGSKLRRTSPEFEQRWRELRSELAGTARPPRAWWNSWLFWPGLPMLAAASLAVVLVLRTQAPTPSVAPDLVTIEDLIGLEVALQPARSLLVAETRDALLYLPAQPRS